MSREKFKRTVNEQRSSQVDDTVDDEELNDVALHKASADCYERRWKTRIKNHKANWWAVAGMYLIVASVAFVVF